MASDSQLPEQFDKYSILGHLATGGMAEVYLARQEGLQGFEKLVVIKRVRPELMRDREITRSFLDEARLVATLQHPNIAQVYEVGMVEGSYFFAMEYVHGADLRQVMQRAIDLNRRVSLADAIYILIQVCTAMHYAHEKRDLDGTPLDIVHRDLTPSNVLLSLEGAVKVCDFGIAKASNRTTETTRGVLKGKYSYMSPEQCRGAALDRRSDVFALGILLYELTTLTKLFSGDSEFEVLRSIVELAVPPPSKRVPHYPADLERIVMRALARDPAQRFQTAQALQLALEDFVRELRLQQSPVSIAKIMGELFDKRLEPWLRAQQEGKPLSQFLIDTAISKVDDLPVFLPIGTSEQELAAFHADTDDRLQTRPRARGSQRTPATQPPVTTSKRRRPSALWLAGAVIGTVAAAGAFVADRVLDRAAGTASTQTLTDDASRISSAIDSAAHSARARAQTIAATPVLRAAIATDAATVRDLAERENVISAAPGETIEIFGGDGGSLVRVPAGAPALAPHGTPIRIEIRQREAQVIASSPITGAGVSGEVVVAMPLDLGAATQLLATHVAAATLEGPHFELAIVPAHDLSNVAPMHLPLAPGHESGLADLSLTVVPVERARAAVWARPVGLASGTIGALCLVLYALGWARARNTA